MQTITRMEQPNPSACSEIGPDQTDPAAYTFFAPAAECAVLFSSPHSGRYYPQSFQDNLRVSLMDLRRVEDAHVDQLIHGVRQLGAGLIKARYARSYVDLNRSETEIDSRMFLDGAPTPAGERSPRVEAGLGCIPRIAASGENIHARMLTRKEAEERLNLAYRPYHAKISESLREIWMRHDQSVLIDCHSMPSIVSGKRIHADIVLGNRHGASCDESLMRLVEREFTRFGYRVLRNMPYAGGYITQKHGMPVEDRHALQIEINRKLYLNEANVELKPGFYRLRDDFLSVAQSILKWAEEKSRAMKARQKS